jgi:hypothetical protein
VFVRCYGYDFLHAGAAARAINVATNAAALSYFAAHGLVLWYVGAGWRSATSPVPCVGTGWPCAAAALSCAGVHRHRQPADSANGVDCAARLE